MPQLKFTLIKVIFSTYQVLDTYVSIAIISKQPSRNSIMEPDVNVFDNQKQSIYSRTSKVLSDPKSSHGNDETTSSDVSSSRIDNKNIATTYSSDNDQTDTVKSHLSSSNPDSSNDSSQLSSETHTSSNEQSESTCESGSSHSTQISSPPPASLPPLGHSANHPQNAESSASEYKSASITNLEAVVSDEKTQGIPRNTRQQRSGTTTPNEAHQKQVVASRGRNHSRKGSKNGSKKSSLSRSGSRRASLCSLSRVAAGSGKVSPSPSGRESPSPTKKGPASRSSSMSKLNKQTLLNKDEPSGGSVRSLSRGTGSGRVSPSPSTQGRALSTKSIQASRSSSISRLINQAPPKTIDNSVTPSHLQKVPVVAQDSAIKNDISAGIATGERTRGAPTYSTHSQNDAMRSEFIPRTGSDTVSLKDMDFPVHQHEPAEYNSDSAIARPASALSNSSGFHDDASIMSGSTESVEFDIF